MNADLVLFNGNIHTMDHDRPWVSALAVRDQRIVAVGEDREMKGLLGRRGRSVDLNRRTVVPGFIDAHIHFLSYGLSLQEIDLVDTTDLTSALARVRERAAATPAGQWLTGRGWDQSLWNDRAFPTRTDLDAVTTEHPVFLRRKCGHVGWANSLALDHAGITSVTKDPDGGVIERQHGGRPTGILKETAIGLIDCLLDEPSEQQAVAAVRTATKTAHEMGITGIHNMEDAAALRAMQQLRASGELTLRVMAQIQEASLDDALALGLQGGLGDEWLRIGAVKVFSDGALGPRTAWMIEPYDEEPDNHGIAVATAGHMDSVLEKAAGAGLAVFTHAIGDRANRVVLDAIEKSRRRDIGSHLRHRIEHAQLLHPDDLPRFAELGVIPSMQPIHCTQDMLVAQKHWGERCRYAYAWHSLLESGAVVAFGSDAPVETPDVLAGIHAAVTRRRTDGFPDAEGWIPQEKLSVDQAVHAYTVGAAYAGNEEHIKGTIAPGKLADFAILSHDVFEVDPMAIPEIDVLATVVGGKFVHDAGIC